MIRLAFNEWRLVRINSTSKTKKILAPIISIIGGILFSAIIIGLTGNDPVDVCSQMIIGSFGSLYGLSETITECIPIMIAALGVSLAFRMQLWNIGAEGQIYMGAFGATWVALSFPNLSPYLLIPVMLIAAIAAGGLWALIASLPKALFNVNETITTLLFNYIAILWVEYLVFGPWKNPKGNNYPVTADFSHNAILPTFGNTSIHIGLIFALLIAVILYITIKYSKWGYEVRVSGQNHKTAVYAGMNSFKNTLIVMFLSGGIAAIAGMTQVSGVLYKLQQNISPGYGYTAVIVALLARLNPLIILPVSVLMAGLLVGGYNLQTSGFSSSMVSMFQGAILFFILGSDFFLNYKLVRRKDTSI